MFGDRPGPQDADLMVPLATRRNRQLEHVVSRSSDTTPGDPPYDTETSNSEGGRGRGPQRPCRPGPSAPTRISVHLNHRARLPVVRQERPTRGLAPARPSPHESTIQGREGRPLVKCPVCDLVQVVFRSGPLTTSCFYCGATWVQDGPEQLAVGQMSSIRKEKSHADTSH
jgi:hypothetical protein